MPHFEHFFKRNKREIKKSVPNILFKIFRICIKNFKVDYQASAPVHKRPFNTSFIQILIALPSLHCNISLNFFFTKKSNKLIYSNPDSASSQDF
ncbi:hypothetical protein BpHYR1_034948 [Brachionus plicatilis]|uniref:Uncharacterized protein n=1 Tax=Brachionus plicatilis TaxID=10195 RepID=A0A3M7PWD0_BRAPC|nr:hypothetical protein BpHYR1_034948 [Brachionus plicatilis]